MRRNRTTCLLTMLAVLAIGGLARAKEMSPVVKADNQLAVDLYGQLTSGEAENVFFSPTSIAIALTMTAEGARGETLDEMLDALHVDDLDAAGKAYARLLKDWNADDKPYKLAVANRLWGQKGYDLLPEFLKATREQYDAPMELLDFAGAPEPSRETINAWVEEKTADKIQNLIPYGAISPLTRLVLTNAIYFKGDWKTPFREEATKEQDFHMSGDATAKVPMMQNKDKFFHGQGDGFQVLGMPYEGGDLSMIVLLPDEVDGLPALEKKLSAEMLDEAASKLRHREVVVMMPKFKLDASFNLNAVLVKLGMKQAFDARTADFSGMTEKPELFISDVIHKAYVDVDEQGTEAAAATAVIMTLRAAMPTEPPPIFRADHPFVFAIRDNKSGAILFLGRYMKP